MEKGYKNVAIFYAKDDYGKGLANAIETRMEELKGKVVDRLSYLQSDPIYFRDVLQNWKDEYIIDAIFFAGDHRIRALLKQWMLPGRDLQVL